MSGGEEKAARGRDSLSDGRPAHVEMKRIGIAR